MRSLLLITIGLLLSGCTRWLADYHLDNAYRYYAEGNCNQVGLELSQAQRQIRARPYLQPEISLLRGQCLERESMFVDAEQTYQFIVSHYPGSEYAYRAKARLNTLEQLGHLRSAVNVSVPVPVPRL
jgi:outer membrane protein assembly factor BamD (BamD/ComL family)